MAHGYKPSTQKAEAEQTFKFKTSLLYTVSSRTVREAQRDPVSKTNKQTKNPND